MKNHDTSVAAYERIKPQLTQLQNKVLAVAKRLKRFTDAEISQELPSYAYSTIPKRRGELVELGRIRKTEDRRNRMAVWEVVEGGETQGELF